MATKTEKKATTAKKTIAKKAAAKKTSVKTNIGKVQATAKTVNNELQKTANFVAKDVLENTKEARQMAVKAVKKFDLTASANKIQATAKKVNSQIVDTTVEMTDSWIQEGKKVANETVSIAQKAMKNIDVAEGISKVGTTAKKVNAYSLKTADEVLDVVKDSSVKWQKVAEKAVAGGFKLADKQQDIVFDTLETVKKQLVKNTSRFVNIFTK